MSTGRYDAERYKGISTLRYTDREPIFKMMNGKVTIQSWALKYDQECYDDGKVTEKNVKKSF